MSFEDATTWSPDEDAPGHYRGQFTADWFQGRGAYGGLVAAGFVRSMEHALSAPKRPLRTLTVNFCAPAQARDAQIRVELPRRGAYVSHLRGTLTQGDDVIAIAQATAARARETHLPSSVELPAPDYPAPEGRPGAPYLEGVMPAFMQHFDVLFEEGGFPFSGAERAVSGGWIRLKRPPAVADVALLAALLDAWAPAVLPAFRQPAGAASIDLSYHFLDPDWGARVGPGDFVAYRAESRYIDEGYAEELAGMWDREGRPLAVVRQLVALFG